MNNSMTTGWIFLCCASHMWSYSTLLYYILLSALLIHLFCRLFPLPHSFFDLFILAQLCKGPKCFCVAHTMSYDSALPVQATCRLPHRLGISVSHWLEFNCVPNQGKCKLVWPHGGHVGPFAGKLCWLKSFLDSKKDHYINEVSVKWWFIWCTGWKYSLHQEDSIGHILNLDVERNTREYFWHVMHRVPGRCIMCDVEQDCIQCLFWELANFTMTDRKLLVIRALTLNASYGWVYLMGHWCFGWIFPFVQFTKKVQVGRTSLLWVWRAMPLVNHNLMTVLVVPWSYSYHMHLYM